MVSIASCVRRSWPASAEELPALPAGGLAVRLAGAPCRRLDETGHITESAARRHQGAGPAPVLPEGISQRVNKIAPMRMFFTSGEKFTSREKFTGKTGHTEARG